MKWIKYWVKKQQDKLGVKISKKSNCADYIKNILKFALEEAKKI